MVTLHTSNANEFATSGVLFRMLGISRDSFAYGGRLFGVFVLPPQTNVERDFDGVGAIQLSGFDIVGWLDGYMERQPHGRMSGVVDKSLGSPLRVGLYGNLYDFPSGAWFRFVHTEQGVALQSLLDSGQLAELFYFRGVTDDVKTALGDLLRVVGSDEITEGRGFLYREPTKDELFSDDLL